jgi:alpha-L-arabinofuranosidase
MIFFDNTRICLTPNYFVQKMFMTNQGDLYFDKIITKVESDTAIAASCVMDSQSGDIILKLVNAGSELKTVNVNLSKFNVLPEAKLTVLSGDAEAENSFDNLPNIVPVESEFIVQKKFTYEMPPMSLTVIRIKTIK